MMMMMMRMMMMKQNNHGGCYNTRWKNTAHQSNEDIEDIEASKLYLEYHPSGFKWDDTPFPEDRVAQMAFL